jgi:hypothetical protein
MTTEDQRKAIGWWAFLASAFHAAWMAAAPSTRASARPDMAEV